ncbi:MAG: hypothetical protein ACI4OR_03250 [Alphaproteobacteria bacterium]
MKKILLFILLLSGCSFSRGIELTALKGQTAETVQKSYGKPVVVRLEGDKQMWAYKKGTCHYLIFFDATRTVQFAESRGECLQ